MAKTAAFKNLKAGKHSATDLDWLQHAELKQINWLENPDLLCAWNALQNTPPKRKDFCLVLKSKINSTINYIENNAQQYAYIKHDKDIVLGEGIHYHFYFSFPNARSFTSVANDMKIPVNALEKPKVSKLKVLEYLTHKNDQTKHQYSDDEVIANFDVLKEIEALKGYDPVQLYHDYRDLRQGKISDEDFYNRYKITIVRR